MEMKRPYIIGIAGPSCAGKTTLARALTEVLLGETAVLSLDSYYRDLSHLSPAERARHNFDEPDALDWPLLREQVHALASGNPIDVPVYDFAEHTRRKEVERMEPTPYVIVEGLFALHDETLVSAYGTAVYVDLRDEECLGRRVERDVAERGRTKESVHAQFAETVLPMARLHIEPTRARADLVIEGSTPPTDAAQTVLAHVERQAAARR